MGPMWKYSCGGLLELHSDMCKKKKKNELSNLFVVD